mmetsp:Transcript_10329/g.14810  ORF Transcript_10329/g.14810 Transcript_10329/m.14810 type:complete len:178 (-) Transcript_10329:162-695(-)
MLEHRGALRHLRVVNDRDPVTILPRSSGKKIWSIFSPVSYIAFKLADGDFEEKETYRHTGIKLKLMKGTTAAEKLEEEDKTLAEDDTLITYELLFSGSKTKKGKMLDQSDSRRVVARGDGTETKVQKMDKNETSLVSSIPDVVFHMGNMYVDNLTGVREELTKKELTLNGLYGRLAE